MEQASGNESDSKSIESLNSIKSGDEIDKSDCENHQKTRGRTYKVDLKRQLKYYQHYSSNILNEEGNIRKASESIFNVKLAKKLRMSPKAIHIQVKKKCSVDIWRKFQGKFIKYHHTYKETTRLFVI